MVEQMCRDIMDFSHGKQKVKSSGIMEFGVSRDQYEPNIFYTWERYDSNGALGRHNTCPEFQAFMENVRPPSDHHHYLSPRKMCNPCCDSSGCLGRRSNYQASIRTASGIAVLCRPLAAQCIT